MEDVMQVAKKGQEFPEVYQPQFSWQFNFHSEYLQRVLRTRTLDEDPEWYHKLHLNYTIALEQLEITAIESKHQQNESKALENALKHDMLNANALSSHPNEDNTEENNETNENENETTEATDENADENNENNEENADTTDNAELAHVLDNVGMNEEDFAKHFETKWKGVVSQFKFSNTKADSSHGKRINIAKFYTSLKPDTDYRIVLDIDMPKWQHTLHSNIYRFSANETVMNRIRNLREKLKNQNKGDRIDPTIAISDEDANVTTLDEDEIEKDEFLTTTGDVPGNSEETEENGNNEDTETAANDAATADAGGNDGAGSEEATEEKTEPVPAWTDDELTVKLMAGSLEHYFILLCSHKWGTTNWALSNILRVIRQITRQESLPIENTFPISLLNNEKYFYSLMNHLMITIRRSAYYGSSSDLRWESLDDWHASKQSNKFGGYSTCKMVASLLMLIFESVIKIYEKGFNSFGGGNYSIDQILKEFQEFMIKWLNWEGYDQSYDGYQIRNDFGKHNELVKQIDSIINKLKNDKTSKLNGFLAWIINVLCIHQRDSQGNMYQFQLDMFYYLKVIFKAVYYLNGQKNSLTKALLSHMSNFKTISTLKQFKSGDLLSLSVKMLANVHHDLYSEDNEIEDKKLAAERVIMILSFIKVIFTTSKELLETDWIDPEEASFLETTKITQMIEKSKQTQQMAQEIKEIDSMAQMSAVLAKNADENNKNNETKEESPEHKENDGSNATESSAETTNKKKIEKYVPVKTPFSNILDRMFKEYWFIAESKDFESMVNGVPQILEDCLGNIGAFYYNSVEMSMRQCVRYLDLRKNLVDSDSGEIINEGDLHKMNSMKQWLSYFSTKNELSMLSTAKEATYNQSCVVLALEYFRAASAYGTTDHFDFINYSTDSSLREYMRSTIYKTTFKLIHSIIEHSYVMATHDKDANDPNSGNNDESSGGKTKNKKAAMNALAAMFVDPNVDEDKKEEELSPQEVMMKFLDAWQLKDQGNLGEFQGKLNFLIKTDEYAEYYTEFINRFYLKWTPCYIILLTHLFEHELRNIASGKYVANRKKSKKKKKNKDKDNNEDENNKSSGDEAALSDEEASVQQLSKIEKIIFSVISVLLLEIIYMPDIYNKYENIKSKLFEEYPWLLKQILGIIWKMIEVDPLFVKTLLQKNPRLMKWMETNAEYREDSGPYRLTERFQLKLIYLLVIKDSDSNDENGGPDESNNDIDAAAAGSSSSLVNEKDGGNAGAAAGGISKQISKVQTLLEEVDKLKKSDNSVLKTLRVGQTKRQKLWQQIRHKNKNKKDNKHKEANATGAGAGASNAANENDTNKDNKDGTSVELYDCICCSNSGTQRYMKFDTFGELKKRSIMYYCDICSMPIRADDDPKVVTPVYYCTHKAYHPNGMYLICNHCAHTANLLIKKEESGNV